MKTIFIILFGFIYFVSNAQTLFQYDTKGNMVSVTYSGKNACNTIPVQVVSTTGVKICPNPTNNILYAQTSTLDLFINKVIIYDETGRLVLLKEYNRKIFVQVDVSNLPAAVYFISFETTERPVSLKFIKVE